jgi:hypothetical protein
VTLGGVANEVARGFHGQPIMLLVVILNVMMLGLIFYVGASQRDERAALTKYLIECHSGQQP